MSEPGPKYHPNQVLRCLHTWATDHPPRPVEDVMWDECWGCYTYSFPLSLIRIEEHKLVPSGDPDLTPEEWIAQYRIKMLERLMSLKEWGL